MVLKERASKLKSSRSETGSFFCKSPEATAKVPSTKSRTGLVKRLEKINAAHKENKIVSTEITKRAKRKVFFKPS